VFVPDYGDYFIMKVVSCRASDIRDIASLIHENGIPKALSQRVKQIVPNPKIFYSRIRRRVIPVSYKFLGTLATLTLTSRNL